MLVHRDISQLPVFRNAVVTIGTFDGVHAGHRKIIDRLKQEAARVNGETVIITFHPHPRKVVRAGQSPVALINTIEEKTGLLEQAGIDHLVITPFTEAFSQLSASQYVEEFLIGRFHPHTVIIGYDHHFGEGRSGNYQLLEQYSNKGLFQLKEIPGHLLDANIVSSTSIRQAIQGCDITLANNLLGYTFFFEGLVVDGNKLGRTLGYPTANLEPDNQEKLIPGNGIYAVQAALVDHPGLYNAARFSPQLLKGMMSIGIRPTIGGTHRVIEVNLFDFSADIYGRIVRVWVKSYLREEVKFDGLDALKKQLDEDKRRSVEILEKPR